MVELNRDYFKKLLFSEDGVPYSIEEAIDKHGLKEISYAILYHRKYEYAETRKLKGCPPKIFLSYRRHSEEDIQLARNIKKILEECGYEVLFDEDHDLSGIWEVKIAEFVSLIATCDIFVPIITDHYFEEDPSRVRWWLHEESNTAIFLQQLGTIEITSIWCSDKSIPCYGDKWRFGNIKVIDCQDRSFTEIPKHFNYSGPKLSTVEQSNLLLEIDHIETFINSNRIVEARKAITNLKSRYYEIEEVRILRFALGRLDGSLDIEESLKYFRKINNLYPINRYSLCKELFYLEEHEKLIEFSWRLARHPRFQHLGHVHLMIGYSLRDLGSFRAAINHFKRSHELQSHNSDYFKSGLLNQIGCMYLELGLARKARIFLLKALELDKSDHFPFVNLIRSYCLESKIKDAIEIRDHAFSVFPEHGLAFFSAVSMRGLAPLINEHDSDLVYCRECSSEYRQDEYRHLCTACSTYSKGDICRTCGHNGKGPRIYKSLVYLCPVCKFGSLAMMDGIDGKKLS